MNITQESDYALRIVDYLSHSYGEIVDAARIAKELVIPLRFTLKILRKLNLYGITTAKRGMNGGYTLKLKPKDINYKMVIEAIEGEIFLNKCLLDAACCNRNYVGKCKINKNLQKIQDLLISELEKHNFDNINLSEVK